MALALTVHIVLLVVRVLRVAADERALVRPAQGLAALLLVQLVLGLATWIVKYGWPVWLGPAWFGLAENDFVVVAEEALQAYLATAHVAVGSLILATSLLVSLRSLRLIRGSAAAATPRVQPLELAV